MSGDREQPRGDRGRRRVRKTQRAVVGAFNELVLGRRYDEIRVDDIVGKADVGRSTFYEHYRGKDDVLIDSMSGMLDVLSSAALESCDLAALRCLLEHFFENRDMARYLLAGPPSRDVGPRIARALAERIERGVEPALRASGAKPALTTRLIATHAAEAQLALLRAWLAHPGDGRPSDVAEGLRRSSRAALLALLGR